MLLDRRHLLQTRVKLKGVCCSASLIVASSFYSVVDYLLKSELIINDIVLCRSLLVSYVPFLLGSCCSCPGILPGLL